MNAGQVTNAIVEIQAVGDEVLEVLKSIDPIAEVPVELAEKLLDLAAQIANKALQTITGINGQPITPAMIQQLSVPTDPLPDPD